MQTEIAANLPPSDVQLGGGCDGLPEGLRQAVADAGRAEP